MSNHDKELTDREYIPLCVLNTFFALTAILFNSVAIHAIRKTTSAFLPKNVRVLLLNLAFSDLSVGLMVQPFYIINLTFRLKSPQGENLKTMNPLTLATGIFFVSASILAVLALSVDRFLAVHLHLRYQEIVTSKRLIFTLILFWVISATISLSGIAKGYNNVRLISLSILIAFCFITIALLQCKIYSVVRRHRYDIRAQQAQGSEQNDSTRETFKRQKPSIQSAFLVYVLLLICFLPHLFTDFAFSKSKGRIRIVHRYTATLLFFNSCLNPVIYCWKFKHIRPTIRMILRNIFCQGHSCTGSSGN
ncbi:adenosine receptor A3-like [Acropora muricata]|uniref:adenosine receptor A3-like n=1 Tax=Acropora muricata TaxID=159855 RepID=UPI0034E5F182